MICVPSTKNLLLRNAAAVALLTFTSLALARPLPSGFREDNCIVVDSKGHVQANGNSDFLSEFQGPRSGKTLLMFFHGGLVPASAGYHHAEYLYQKAFDLPDCFPAFVVWNSDFVTTIESIKGSDPAMKAATWEYPVMATNLGKFTDNELANRPDPTTRSQRLASNIKHSLGIFSSQSHAEALAAIFQPWINSRVDSPHPEDPLGADSTHFDNVLGPYMKFVWDRMKDFVSYGTNKDDSDSLAGNMIATLKSDPPKRIVLVGHSAGAIYAMRLIKAIAPDFPNTEFDVIFMAPAISYSELSTDIQQFGDRIKNFRMYGLSDELEQKDHVLVDAVELKSIPIIGKWLYDHFYNLYKGSLLYFISSALENGYDVPLLGMQRYSTSRDDFTPGERGDFDSVSNRFKLGDNSGWSIFTPGQDDPRKAFATDSHVHGDFAENDLTARSLQATIQEWTMATTNPFEAFLRKSHLVRP